MNAIGAVGQPQLLRLSDHWAYVKAGTPLQILERGAAELGVILSSAQLEQFDRYLAELHKWNRKMNLTGTEEPREVVTRHVLDSLAGFHVLSSLPPDVHIADLGSGAGFPGLPIKIARPDVHMTLIEPRQKRAAFLTTVCALLKIPNTEIVESTVDPKHPPVDLANRFDRVLMRAVAEPQKARSMALPLCNPGGWVVIWASTAQAVNAGSEFAVHTYRIPHTNLTHVLLICPPTAQCSTWNIPRS